FDHAAYGSTGATVDKLVSNLIRDSGIRGVDGPIVADATYFDSLRSTAESHYHVDSDMTGELSGLAFDRGFANFSGTEYQAHPALYAGAQFESALRSAGVKLTRRAVVSTGRTPTGGAVRLLTQVRSPRI